MMRTGVQTKAWAKSFGNPRAAPSQTGIAHETGDNNPPSDLRRRLDSLSVHIDRPTPNRSFHLRHWKILAPLFALAMYGATSGAELSPGDAAPDFKMQGSDGKMHSLADYKGKRAIVIAWYPKAFTGG